MTSILIFAVFFIFGLLIAGGIVDAFTNPQSFSEWMAGENKSRTPEERESDSNWSFKMIWGKCPYCREEISRGAVRCPKCTANLDPTKNNGK